jgi:hypothetical protein
VPLEGGVDGHLQVAIGRPAHRRNHQSSGGRIETLSAENCAIFALKCGSGHRYVTMQPWYRLHQCLWLPVSGQAAADPAGARSGRFRGSIAAVEAILSGIIFDK